MRTAILILLLTLVCALALPSLAFADAGGGKVAQPGNPTNPLDGSAAEENVSTPGGVTIWVCGAERSAVLA